jgi:hypothetical protein
MRRGLPLYEFQKIDLPLRWTVLGDVVEAWLAKWANGGPALLQYVGYVPINF